MNMFLWNLLLALTWTVSSGQFTVPTFLAGLVLGYFILLFSQRALGPSPYFAKVPLAGRFALFYLGQLILANLRVAYDVATPNFHVRPGVIAVPLDARTDVEITLLANLITLTPGTLSLDLSADRTVLYVHAMYIDHDDVAEARRQIKEGLERRVLELLR